nr:RusA family crossover junction endodeoxyribonuclease [Gibbsiella quercinecans]
MAGLGYVVSEKGRQFKAEAVAQVLEQLRRRPRSITGTVSVSVVLCPPNKARRDLDNYFKALFDAMTYAGVWLDDSQVKKIAAEWGPVTKGGKVELRISEVLA